MTTDTDAALALEVELKPEQVQANKGPPPAEIIMPKEGIDDLKKELEESKAAQQKRLADFQRQIDEAARIASAESKRADAAEVKIVETQRDHIATTVDLLAKEKDTAKRDYAEAMAAGEFAKAADAQDRMAMVAARMVEADRGQVAIEDDLKARQERPKPLPVTPSLSKVDQLARNLEARGNTRSAAWVRAHPDYANDPSLGEKVERAHFFALSEGYSLESDAYFNAINERLGLNGGEARGAQQTSRIESPISAPVSRQSNPGSYQPGKGMPKSVRLSAAQVETAKSMNMSPEAYARQLLALVDEGKIDPKNINIA